jgi:hypothetical protein
MSDVLKTLLREFDLGPPARSEEIANAERALAARFPESYRAFLDQANGGEGPIGEESYVILWPAEELAERNEGYRPDPDYAPDLVFIGSDGGNEVFGFRRDDGAFVAAPLIGMAPEEVRVCGRSLREFLASFR